MFDVIISSSDRRFEGLNECGLRFSRRPTHAIRLNNETAKDETPGDVQRSSSRSPTGMATRKATTTADPPASRKDDNQNAKAITNATVGATARYDLSNGTL